MTAAVARRSHDAGVALRALYRDAARHHLPLVAAGLSFYGLLAMFPVLLVMLSIRARSSATSRRPRAFCPTRSSSCSGARCTS
jgi:uncharacterized BrkB/YihY/UPF0761 family membrane protein